MKGWITSSLAILFFVSCLATRSYAIDHSEDIFLDERWASADNPHIITNHVTVNAGITLTIDPGVVVKSSLGYSLVIKGTLNADGTPSDPIYFTSLQDDTVGGSSFLISGIEACG